MSLTPPASRLSPNGRKKWLVQPRAIALQLTIQKKSNAMVWKSHGNVLMISAWISCPPFGFLTGHKRKGHLVLMPLLPQPEGRQSTKMDHFFPSTQYT